ncbi:type II/III secretion system short domain-containing protein [Neorhodopirellula lusitana]|uniref:Type II/III secretion system short domain-containing protein n=1 Tax=Neorhodopirellula lusitana TaxID=445327 RepID=A0ABY1QHM1_9BACT|nr:secretin N-terminal domain-containing protein [Neorhodopirellula lusitana]SMP71261.1 type II/III secretion system short domain-containing protein [Neorhodopirellula lusitana]
MLGSVSAFAQVPATPASATTEQSSLESGEPSPSTEPLQASDSWQPTESLNPAESASANPTTAQPGVLPPNTESTALGDADSGEADLVAAEPEPRTVPAVPAQLRTGSELRFSFNAAPWRDVIEWVADEAGLALQFGELPTGSFTYNDNGSFTPEEAINRVNLFLIPEGFAIVRSGNLLAVVNLTDPRSLSQLDSIAEMITPEELATRNGHEVVKCLFQLAELDANDAVEELSSLQLMTPPSVLAVTNQLMITDTVSKLRSVQAILDSFQPTAMKNGTMVKSFRLQHVDAEDVLEVARPHLGLATGEMIGIDVSLSADVLGKHLFVTGVEDKIKVIEGLVEAIDQPDPDADAVQRDSVLKSHLVEGGNVQMVYDVLQTLLAGKPVRLSIDETAGSIVALADVQTQREIEMTVEQLQATEADFEVIQLKTIDAYYAISLLEQMLDIPASTLDDDDDSGQDFPKIDADAGNRRLFVRAKRPQIEQIKKIVADLEASESNNVGKDVRVLPMPSEGSERTLQTAIQFWRGDNPISRVSSDAWDSAPSERVPAQQIKPESTPLVDEDLREEEIQPVKKTPQSERGSKSHRRDQSFTNLSHPTELVGKVGPNIVSEDAPIRYQVTSRGLLLQSHDTEALDQFEELIRVIMGPTDAVSSKPIVFYMQYTKADDALRMLTKLLDGGESAKEADLGTLVNGYSSTSSFLSGSYLTTSEGTLTLTSGTMTVVADTRLNRLIAQGATDDIQRMEYYLKIIDKPEGITDVLTNGRPHVVELVNIKATEAAELIREAFGSRVASNEKASGGGQAAKKPTPDPRTSRADAAAKLAAMAKAASQPKDLAPKMTVAVHEASNSLVITAPESLLKEVQDLVSVIDSRGVQSIEVVVPSNVFVVEEALQGLLIETSRSRPSTNRPRPREGR